MQNYLLITFLKLLHPNNFLGFGDYCKILNIESNTFSKRILFFCSLNVCELKTGTNTVARSDIFYGAWGWETYRSIRYIFVPEAKNKWHFFSAHHAQTQLQYMQMDTWSNFVDFFSRIKFSIINVQIKHGWR